MSVALERFWQCFRGAGERPRSGSGSTPDDRVRAALDLHADWADVDVLLREHAERLDDGYIDARAAE